jgi:hypothetical protein
MVRRACEFQLNLAGGEVHLRKPRHMVFFSRRGSDVHFRFFSTRQICPLGPPGYTHGYELRYHGRDHSGIHEGKIISDGTSKLQRPDSSSLFT